MQALAQHWITVGEQVVQGYFVHPCSKVFDNRKEIGLHDGYTAHTAEANYWGLL